MRARNAFLVFAGGFFPRAHAIKPCLIAYRFFVQPGCTRARKHFRCGTFANVRTACSVGSQSRRAFFTSTPDGGAPFDVWANRISSLS
ncbi:hypothetical protein PF004_g33035 [Phytophthora fragariae]|uniref:Uncharacterized protein n=1 Tax=Phytophthora fragariae TaxID=53985 RepID=A0A6G0M4H4_9STRA|nr:hypothetical protein PF004_g33035 [Phytophthora fragariae]